MKAYKLLTLPLLVTLLTGCHGYRSKYDAKFLVQSNSGTEATLDFAEFKGKIVFDLRRTSKGEGTISYTASLEEGTIKAYYYDVFMDVESELFIIGGGQELSDTWGYVESGRKYLIIVESYGIAIDGNFTFNINSY